MHFLFLFLKLENSNNIYIRLTKNLLKNYLEKNNKFQK